MIARLVAIAAGAWLVFAPAVLDHGPAATDQVRTFGPVIASLSLVAIWPLGRPLRWVTLPLGAWLAATPLLIHYDSPTAALNAIAAGIVVMATAPLGRIDLQPYGGGWRALVQGRGTNTEAPGL